jgi:protein-arginine kinase activator protein McsA
MSEDTIIPLFELENLTRKCPKCEDNKAYILGLKLMNNKTMKLVLRAKCKNCGEEYDYNIQFAKHELMVMYLINLKLNILHEMLLEKSSAK